jgi:hypothetical protein
VYPGCIGSGESRSVNVRTLERASPSDGHSAASSLAPGQEAEWELMKELCPEEPGCARNLVVHTRYLHGSLDRRAMECAFLDVTRRHESLRLVLESVDVDPRLRIEEDVEPPVELLDLSRFGERKQETLLRELMYRERRRCFDLRNGPAWHAWFVRLGPTTHVVNVCLSHLVADGSSSRVFIADLMAAYGARVDGAAARTEPAPSFAELRALQARRREPTPERLRYWRERLTPLPEGWAFTPRPKPNGDLVLSLRTGKPRTTVEVVAHERKTKIERRAIFLCAGYPFVSTETPPEATLHEVMRATDRSLQEAIDNQVPYKALARAVNPAFDSGRPWSARHVFDGDFTSWAFDEPALELAGLDGRVHGPARCARATAGGRRGGADVGRGRFGPT